MGRFLRAIVLTLVITGVTGMAFAIYAHFAVDYSLESLELALTATEQHAAENEKMSGNIYRRLVQDLAFEEASREDADMQSLALLEMASRSLDEVVEKAGYQRAQVYLSETVASKVDARSILLRLSDRIYRFLKRVYHNAVSVYQYFRRQMVPEVKEELEVSSLLLLTQAEEKEKEWELDEAAELYRRFLEFYPGHQDESYVVIALAHVLTKQKNYAEAERLLRGLQLESRSVEDFELASNLVRRIQAYKARDQQIKQLKRLIPANEGTIQGERLRMKLGLLYLYSYSLEEAQETFRELQAARDEKVRAKAKFYMGWIYKLQAQYDQGAKVLLELLNQEQLGKELGLGLNAQLADIFYQNHNVEEALSYYRKLSTEEGQDKGAWHTLAETEQATLYYFDLKDPEKGREHLANLGGFQGAAEGLDLEKAMLSASELSLRDYAFRALKNGEFFDAVELFKKKVKQDPDDAWSHSGLASTYVMLSDLYLANEHAHKGYDLLLDEYTASVMAFVSGYKKDSKSAVGYYTSALELNPIYLPAKFNIACMFLEEGRYKDALGILQDLEVEFSQVKNIMRAKVLNNTGYALWQLGRYEEAMEAFHGALDVMPRFQDALDNLSLILHGDAPKMVNAAE